MQTYAQKEIFSNTFAYVVSLSEAILRYFLLFSSLSECIFEWPKVIFLIIILIYQNYVINSKAGMSRLVFLWENCQTC